MRCPDYGDYVGPLSHGEVLDLEFCDADLRSRAVDGVLENYFEDVIPCFAFRVLALGEAVTGEEFGLIDFDILERRWAESDRRYRELSSGIPRSGSDPVRSVRNRAARKARRITRKCG